MSDSNAGSWKMTAVVVVLVLGTIGGLVVGMRAIRQKQQRQAELAMAANQPAVPRVESQGDRPAATVPAAPPAPAVVKPSTPPTMKAPSWRFVPHEGEPYARYDDLAEAYNSGVYKTAKGRGRLYMSFKAHPQWMKTSFNESTARLWEGGYSAHLEDMTWDDFDQLDFFGVMYGAFTSVPANERESMLALLDEVAVRFGAQHPHFPGIHFDGLKLDALLVLERRGVTPNPDNSDVKKFIRKTEEREGPTPETTFFRKYVTPSEDDPGRRTHVRP